MAGDAGVTRIDPDSWQVTILPLPKRFSRGTALGFCGGHVVGRAETARAKSLACWWPGGEPELLTLEGHEYLAAGRAGGDVIPGHWIDQKSGGLRAVVWRLQSGRLVGAALHDAQYQNSWATAAGGDAAVGIGALPTKPGQRGLKVGLLWRAGERAEVAGANDVTLEATDGTRVAGSLGARATLWPSTSAPPIDLSPAGVSMSEVEALDGELQIGIAWKGMCARAALWRGSAASFTDLTPKGFEAGRGQAGAGGFQVGFVRPKDTTRNGSTAVDNRAVLWQGAADRWLDLNALLPAKKYNASVAWAIEIRGDTVRICGQATRYEVSDPGTPRESHFEPVAHPVLWTARLKD